jgi:uncharacterized membrane protein
VTYRVLIVNTLVMMMAVRTRSAYDRWLGWHAHELRRAGAVLAVGLVTTLALLPFVATSLALLGGWDVSAFVFLLTTWPVMNRADGMLAHQLATREDPTRASSTALLIGASLASLLGVGFALRLAGREGGASQAVLIGVAVLTVALSWLLANTVYALRYAHLHFSSTRPGIAFDNSDRQELPGYRDFAYVAFTVGMCYQVSDTTLLNPRIRRTALAHAILSYVFGVVIVAGSVNLISGLVR